jgi:hypothetical protein
MSDDIHVMPFADPGLEQCIDRPHIEIAWDQWSRTRICTGSSTR